MLKSLTTALLILCSICSSQLWGQETAKSLKKNETYLRADSLANVGKTAEARILYLQARESFERKQLWPPFVETTIAFATTYAGTEDYQIGIDQLEDALAKTAFDIEGQADLRALLYGQMGTLYDQAHEYKLAKDARKEQLEMLNLAYEPDSNWGFVEVYYRLAFGLYIFRDTEAALNYSLKAQAAAAKLNYTNYRLTCAAYRSFGFIHANTTGLYEQALKSFEKGLKLALAHPQKEDFYVYDFYIRIANVYEKMGELQQALFYHQKGLSMLDTLSPDYSYLSAYQLLATLHEELQQWDKSLFYFKKALEMSELDSARLSGKISVYLGLCTTYRRMKQYDMAFSMIEKADSLLQIQVQRKDDPLETYHYQRGLRWHLAKLWEVVGDVAQAKYFYMDLLQNFSREESKFQDIESLNDLAYIYEKENKVDSALYYNQLALIASCKIFDSADSSKLPLISDLRENIETYQTLNQKIHLTIKRAANSDNMLIRDQQREYSMEIVDLADQFHVANLKKMNLLRRGGNSAILDHSIQIYLQGLTIAHNLNQQTEANRFLKKGFYYTQKMKAQRLWLTILNSEASSFCNLPTALLEKERDLLADIQYYEKMALEAKEKGNTAAVNRYKNEYLFEKQIDYRELVQQMETDYPDYYESKYNFIPETESSLQPLLNENELLIEYVLADSALFVFTLSQNEPMRLINIPLSAQTTEQIESLQKMLQNSAMLRQSSPENRIGKTLSVHPPRRT